MSEAVLEPQAAEPPTKRPRLGFLGVGWIGRHRLQAISDSGLAEIAAVSDTQREMTEQAQAVAPQAAVARSLEEMLEMDLEGLVIATPNVLHASQSITALRRGLAVFCQKPLARSAQEAAEVVQAARQADRLLGVDLSYRYIPAMGRIRELIRSGELGQVYAVNLVFHNAYGPDKGWFYDRNLSGGGCLLDLGIHLVDLAMWSLDWPQLTSASGRLFAGGTPLKLPAEQVEDYATATVDFASGTAVQLACSWKLSAGCDAVIEASFYGTRGGARLHNVGGSFFDFEAYRFHGTQRELLSTPEDRWFGEAAVAWACRLASGERFDPQCEHLVDVSRVLDRIYGQGGSP